MRLREVSDKVRFGPYEADFAQGLLRKEGKRIGVQAKPFALLEMLVRKPGEIVSREELRNGLWPEDVFVDFDKNLATAINKLRAILGDSANSPRYIETVARRGYRFLAPVEAVAPPQAEAPGSPHSAKPAPAPLLSDEAPPAVLPHGRMSRQDGSAAEPAEPMPSRPITQHRIFWIGAALGGLAVVTLIVVSALRPGVAKPKLSESGALVLADFQNSTGDAIFDDTLRQGLATQLDQSPFLNVVSDASINRTLALMERPPGSFLSPGVARQVCQRDGAVAAIDGSIARVGGGYVVGLSAVGCPRGDLLAETQATAGSRNEVLGALGQAASALRKELGESLASIDRFDVPLAQATTSLLEALKAFSLGQKAASAQGAAQSLPYDQRAIALDPDFAMAYEAAGVHYSNLGEPARAAEYLTKAFQLRSRTSQRERLRIEASYYSSVTGQLEKAAEAYRETIANYPGDIPAYNNLGIVFAEQGRYQQAVDITRKGLRLDPGEITLDENLTGYLLALGQFDAARQIIREAQPKKPDNYIFPAARYVLGFLRSDSQAMAEQEKWFAGRPAYANFGLALAAGTAAYGGELSKGRDLTGEAVRSAVQADARETGAIWQGIAAQWEAAYGFNAEARRSADAALHLDPTSEGTEAEAALAVALAGDAPGAESLARDLGKRFPLDTQMQELWLPAIRAEVELNRKDPAAALKSLEADPAPLEFGTIAFAANASGSCLYPSFVRGQADLAAGRGAAAAGEFQEILDHSGLVWNCWTGAMSRLGLARADALVAGTMKGAEGDAARVRALGAYETFLDSWKNASPGIPVLAAAKAEYERLLSR